MTSGPDPADTDNRLPSRTPAGDDNQPPLTLRGLLYMVLSCVFFALMGALVYGIQLSEPASSVFVTTFFRVLVNLVILFAWALWTRDIRDLTGDRRGSLWMRGFFGALAMMCSFSAIRSIGLGESSFLHASNGVFVAMLAPIFLKQRSSLKIWLAVLGSVAGIWLLFEPRFGDTMPWGRGLALLSGLLSALAYLMIARAGRSNSANSVIFYLCITSVVMHLALFIFEPVTWPVHGLTWVMLAFTGVLGSVAQLYLTKAYQMAPAALNSAVSYLLPVLNMILGILLFGRVPDQRAWIGAGVILAFGVILPFLRFRTAPPAPPGSPESSSGTAPGPRAWT